MNESSPPTSDEVVAYFQRHVVPIVITYQSDRLRACAITAFVMSVSGHWFLVTAGHVLKELDRLISNAACRIRSCHLVDSAGLDAKHREPVPFDIESAPRIMFGDQHDYDYAVIPLSAHYRRLLEANAVQPLDETVWKLQPKDAEFHYVLGFPAELTGVDYTTTDEQEVGAVRIACTLHVVEKLDERPAEIADTNAPRFYGRISMRSPVTDIKGMSGGPILAFRRTEEGLKYWLVALQSTWHKPTAFIAGCPTQLFGSFLEHVIRTRENDDADSEAAADDTAAE